MSEQTPLEKEDIYPSPLKEQDLEDQDLKTLRKEVETKAREAIDWYIKRKRTKSTGSKVLRISAILFIFVGALSPILQGIDWLKLQDCQYGYIALALAATCVVIDKFMGFSSSWMRYMTTAIVLQKALVGFQTDWLLLWTEVNDDTPTVEQRKKLLYCIKNFRLKIISEIERETQLWTHEFQNNLSQMEVVTKNQQETQRPGIIDLTVTNGNLAEQGLTVVINGVAVALMRGQQLKIGHILPGQHDVRVQGVVEGREVQASGVVNMITGTIAELKLSLPVSQPEK
ncbi:SLATT domain-containing protein [Candidatus Parabeggiatoa sp. HSG14]|uniref:SLATT domain-containing protein n=1 Tax=Candidatus Parabeggiatoa sp. HSG14 TaxID=3055593 RepID=UPI0025A6CF2B|nr:SLATT domain-containing protein [Thiotrichales bacterium HSG14]